MTTNMHTTEDGNIGDRRHRSEDPPLLTGDARYTDDIVYPDQAYMALCRSQHAAASFEIDASDAVALEGILAVYGWSDIEASDSPGYLATAGEDYVQTVKRPMLADGHVRYQGEPIAVVIADDRYTAQRGLDALDVRYDRQDAITDPVAARAKDAPVVHEDVDRNTAVDWELGDQEETDAEFDRADNTVSLELTNQRLAPTPIEPRAVVAQFNASTGEYTIEMASQAPHYHGQYIGEALDVPERKIRVISPDVGGGFGGKAHPYHSQALAAWCARRIDRPLKWQATRSEELASMCHGRGHVAEAELAFDNDGTIRALRAETSVSLGAYVSKTGARLPTRTYTRMLSGSYDMAAVYCRVYGAYTNAVPTDAYRGAGRPESVYIVERLVDRAATELEMDPVEIRKHNFIPSESFPHRVATGHVYDSGDYHGALDKAVDRIDYNALRVRQRKLREQGRYLGIGVCSFVEGCGTGPGRPGVGLIRFNAAGDVVVQAGTHDHGQGHATTYAQIVSDQLGVPFEDISVVEGDTGRVPHGNGTYGSRSTPVGGNAIVKCTEKIVEKGLTIAAGEFEAPVEDVEFVDGAFRVRGAPDRQISIQAVARRAYRGGHLPEDAEPGFEATTFWEPDSYTFPFGTHIAVVEVDPPTGEITLERYLAVDDVGNQINPRIVEGQVHGGVVQGIGQALYEHAQYDQNGTLVTSSLQDYAVPKALHVPEIETDYTITPCPNNPLGVKGVGEAGAIAAPPTIVNAVVDALEPYGVEHIDMPITDEKVWDAIDESG